MMRSTRARRLPLKLYPNKLILLGALVLCLAFVAIGIWMVSSGEWTGYFGLVTFSIGALVFAIQMLPNSSYLLLEETGFTVCTLFRKYQTRWNEVSEFVEITIGSNRMVGIIYAAETSIDVNSRQISYAISGAEGALPDSYGMKVRDLTALMNQLCLEYGSEMQQ